jgi:hypothetical protein
MATRKKKIESTEPIVTIGSHSVRTQYPDGRVEFVVDDDKLKADVLAALEEYTLSNKKPSVKAKTTRKKKVSCET